ncbi:MAG: CUAEP/CCAEP-tail radical SAM (seleno)protein [Chloroflexota bacterium]
MAVNAPRQQTVVAPFRDPGAVLLLSCYELGREPLNLAFPAAYLQRAGYKPRSVDMAIDPLGDDAIRDARLVAISVPMHTALRLGIEVAQRVRRVNPGARICFYGLYAWMNAEYILEEFGDYVIGGEFEQPLLELVQDLESGGDGDVDGVSTSGRRREPSLVRIEFPAPDRSELPGAGKYAWLIDGDRQVPAGYTEATRGCHHLCKHCPVVPLYNGRFFAVPRSVVIDDIQSQVKRGAEHISFGDPDALNGPTHLLRIMRAIHDEYPSVTFDITTRVEHILENREIFPELGDLGCIFIISAVESLSDLVLERIDKGHRKEDVVEALAICDDAGIALRPSLLPFTPWTTMDDYIKLLTFIEEHEMIEHVDPVHLSIRLLVPPGSSLLDEEETREWIGPLDRAALTYRWTHEDPRVDALQQRVASIAESAEQDGWDPYDTFAAIRMATYQIAGLPAPDIPVKRGSRKPPPRLTESWFC